MEVKEAEEEEVHGCKVKEEEEEGVHGCKVKEEEEEAVQVQVRVEVEAPVHARGRALAGGSRAQRLVGVQGRSALVGPGRSLGRRRQTAFVG